MHRRAAPLDWSAEIRAKSIAIIRSRTQEARVVARAPRSAGIHRGASASWNSVS
jgi:hypothetical protein